MNERYKNTINRLSLYFLSSILASIAFGCLVGLYDSVVNEDSWGFTSIAILFILYTLPIYGFVVIPYALFVDYSKKTKALTQSKKFLLYVIAGALAGGVYGAILLGPLYTSAGEFVLPIIYGVVSAVIFFCLLTLIKKWR